MNTRAVAASGAGLTAVAGVTAVLRFIGVTNSTTVALSFLLVVLFVAAARPLAAAVITSLAAMLCFNYFFLPPVGTWTIAEPQNWIALFALLVTSIVASQLSARARARAEEARARRRELARLFDLTRDILLTTDEGDLMPALARHIARRFEVTPVALTFPAPQGGWRIHEGGAKAAAPGEADLDKAMASARGALEFDADTRSYAGHRTVVGREVTLSLVPLRLGTAPIGLLVVAADELEPGTLDAIGGIVAIAFERSQLVRERRHAEIARERAELSSALLAAMGHDLRTPLTALRVAVENLSAASLSAQDRDEQRRLAMKQAEKLARTFDAILDMARIESRAVHASREWCAVADVIDAAMAQVAPALDAHHVRIAAQPDDEALVDPRLTASAVAHLLENAARYSPAGSTITIQAWIDPHGLRLSVSDEGPGITETDLGDLFTPLYRGAAGRASGAGTGMGLAITRGLLAAENGSVWAGNGPGSGAVFSIAVPAQVRTAGLTETAGA